MCGISGIINHNNVPVQHSDIECMNELIRHRGPDGDGFFYGDTFAFGHRRLAILDLSEDGAQPMSYQQKYTITYNGEIYNFIEIRQRLQSEGYTFNSTSDTEVILAAYDKWGEECVKQFNGMWAFAIYDKEKNIIFCSRDRFGIKPFYYTEIDGKFIFGSEIKQLLHFYAQAYVNKKVLMDYVIVGLEEHTNETFFDGIYKLEQSHNLTYDLYSHTFSCTRYYDISCSSKSMSEEQAIHNYRESLEQSVALRLRSDVKVGTCLSGGLDSSSIAAIASTLYKEQTGESFFAIHAKSSQQSNDESNFATQVAEHCDLKLHTVEPTVNDFKRVIDDVIYTQEEPFGGPSIVMQYFVMEKARELNCTVLLDGQGGDETLLGYERYYPAYLKSLGFVNGIKGLFNASKNSRLSIKELVQYCFYFTSAKLRVRHLLKKNNFIESDFSNIISKDTLNENAESYLNIFDLQHLEIYKTQMPHLLKYEDKNSMKHGIETRLPFIDYKVLESALATPNTYKIKNGWTKYVLRKAVDTLLPQNVVWRKHKLGFEAPDKTWLNAHQLHMCKAVEQSAIIKHISNTPVPFHQLDDSQQWRLFNVAKWEQIFDIRWK